jgi:TRAP-type C4-dicarboxylate transport system permease small subunit
LQQTIERLARWMHWLGAVLTVLMMLLVCYDVFARQLFNLPFHGTAELAATALVLIVFLQVPQAIVEHKLLRVTFLYDWMGPLGRSALNALAWGAGTLVFGGLALTSWGPLVAGLGAAEFYGMDSFRIPAWPIRVGTLALWVIAAMVCLYLFLESLRGRMTAAENQLPD